MRIWDFSRSTFGICAAAAMLAACGGSQPPIGAPGAMQQSRAVATHTEHAQSWMRQGVSKNDLLYVTDLQEVRVFSYPRGKYEGTLRGFREAIGTCTDHNGNIYIADLGYSQLFEYAHGGNKRLRAINTGNPQGCSVDPTSGNLAVTNDATFSKAGGVAILTKAHGKPKYYRDPDFFYYVFCGYDGQGNLFIDGANESTNQTEFAELPKGGSKLVTITLNQKIGSPGGVQWDGQHVVVGDITNATVYAFAISGSQGVLAGQTHFNGAKEVVQTWIEGQRIIAPDSVIVGGAKVLIYDYPAGGSPVKTISKHVLEPQGAVISKAPAN
jgi:hypothetical protein